MRLFSIISACLLIVLLHARCTSDNENQDLINVSPCIAYDEMYDSLKSFVANNNNIGGFSSWEFRNNIAKTIDNVLDTLRNIQCEHRNDTLFVARLLSKIDSLNSADKRKSEEETANGEDWMMDGVDISEQKIVFNSDMQPYVILKVQNKTTASIASIEFQIVYCNETINANTAMVRYDPDCFDNIKIKGLIPLKSTKEYNLPIEEPKYQSSISTKVYINKILKSNGELVKRINLH